MLIDDAQVHEEMRRQRLELEVGTRQRQLRALAHRRQQRVDQAAVGKGSCIAEGLRELGQGHQARTRALRQALGQGQHFRVQHARHQPFAALVARLVQRIDRQRHGHAVAQVARLVQVLHGAVDATQTDRAREGRARDAGGLVPHQRLTRQEQQLRVGLAGFAVPALEGRAAGRLGWQLALVEGVDQRVVDQHVLAP